jgi:hypothetical protein
MWLIGPRGWHCLSTVGADGQGGTSIAAPGKRAPYNYPTRLPLTEEAIIGHETAGSADPTFEQACPLFPIAHAEFFKYNPRSTPQLCPASPPPQELVRHIVDGDVEFTDPPRLAGDGYPSGGQYAALGVMTYHDRRGGSSWLETCTLPPTLSSVCSWSLRYFIERYGNN